MRTPFLSLLLLPAIASAQCPFNPTIEPANPVLCPGEQMTLSTQAYDSYQWYKDGQPIDGATTQSWTVDYSTDGGSEITVEATDEGCTEMSPGAVVDGWVFLPMYVIHGGDEPAYLGEHGEPHFCEGDVFTLTMGMTGAVNITWYRNGVELEDEHETTLEITTTGNYSCSAAPDICPNSILHLGLEVQAIFHPMEQAVIELNGEGDLCASPEGLAYEWSLNGQPLVGADSACITAAGPGSYTVLVDYGQACQEASEPFILMSTPGLVAHDLWVGPNPADRTLTLRTDNGMLDIEGWRIIDLSGAVMLSGRSAKGPSLDIDVSGLAGGVYFLLPLGGERSPVRFVKR